MNYRNYTIFWQEVYFLMVGIFWTTVFCRNFVYKNKLQISFKENANNKIWKMLQEVLKYIFGEGVIVMLFVKGEKVLCCWFLCNFFLM